MTVAARAHQAQELVVAIDGCLEERLVTEARARHLPQKRALPPRRCHDGLDEAGRGGRAPAWCASLARDVEEEGLARVGLRPDQARVLAILGIAPVLRARVGALQAKGGGARFQHGPEALTENADLKICNESNLFFS